MAKEYKTIAAAQKAGSMYFTGKDGKKKLAVTKEQLDAWKKKNKGKYTGSALTAWANAKGKDIGGGSSARASSPKPKLRPGSQSAGPGMGVMTKAEKDEVDADGNPVYQGIDQSKLVPLLVATIKELEARITALENA